SNIGQYENALRSLADYHRTVQLGLVAFFRQDGAAVGREPQERVGKKRLASLFSARTRGWSANSMRS
ncbi:MAG: hypothetical protein P8130_14795, partial [Deltaproteobacteria bacterium]